MTKEVSLTATGSTVTITLNNIGRLPVEVQSPKRGVSSPPGGSKRNAAATEADGIFKCTHYRSRARTGG